MRGDTPWAKAYHYGADLRWHASEANRMAAVARRDVQLFDRASDDAEAALGRAEKQEAVAGDLLWQLGNVPYEMWQAVQDDAAGDGCAR